LLDTNWLIVATGPGDAQTASIKSL
jgi:hypothetical protein